MVLTPWKQPGSGWSNYLQGMGSGLVFNEHYLDHVIEPGHPESPSRLRAIARKLDETGLRKHFRPIAALAAPFPAIAAVRSPRHIESVRAIPVTGSIAALAVGGVGALATVVALCEGRVTNAICAVRLPGQHAHNQGEITFVAADAASDLPGTSLQPRNVAATTATWDALGFPAIPARRMHFPR